MAVSLEEITEDHFHSPKTAEDHLNFLKESTVFQSQQCTETTGQSKFFLQV